MRPILFYERQHLAPWAHGIVLASGIIGLILLLPGTTGQIPAPQGLAGLVMITLSVILLNFFTATTYVYEDKISIYFGRLLRYQKTNIPLAAIQEARAVEYTPIRQAGGWGIRIGNFKGNSTHFLTTRGTQGLLIQTEDRRYLIGTQHPSQFQQAVARQLTNPHPAPAIPDET